MYLHQTFTNWANVPDNIEEDEKYVAEAHYHCNHCNKDYKGNKLFVHPITGNVTITHTCKSPKSKKKGKKLQRILNKHYTENTCKNKPICKESCCEAHYITYFVVKNTTYREEYIKQKQQQQSKLQSTTISRHLKISLNSNSKINKQNISANNLQSALPALSDSDDDIEITTNANKKRKVISNDKNDIFNNLESFVFGQNDLHTSVKSHSLDALPNINLVSMTNTNNNVLKTVSQKERMRAYRHQQIASNGNNVKKFNKSINKYDQMTPVFTKKVNKNKSKSKNTNKNNENQNNSNNTTNKNNNNSVSLNNSLDSSLCAMEKMFTNWNPLWTDLQVTFN